MMTVERGFRRLTAVISVVIFCLALAPAGYVSLRFWAIDLHDRCTAKTWEEGKEFHLQPDRRLDYVMGKCGDNPVYEYMVTFVMVVNWWILYPTGGLDWILDRGPHWLLWSLRGQLVMFVTESVVAGAVLALVPWMVFRVLSWGRARVRWA
jgi:hypothetical protein